jgi:hypothetical protein
MIKTKIIIIFILSLIISNSKLYSQTISYPDSSVLAHGNWYKISIQSSGVYKLTYNDFISLGIPKEDIISKNISIYGNGGHKISSNNSLCTFSDLKENSIYVHDPNNNFSQGGFVLFYAEGGTEWEYDKSNREWDFFIHPYSDEYYYYVTFNDSIGEKKRIGSLSTQTLTADTIINSSRDYFLSKQEITNINHSGRRWVGKQFGLNKTEEFPLDLRNALVDGNNNLVTPAMLEYRLISKSDAPANFNTNYNNQIFDTIVMLSDGGVRERVIKTNLNNIKLASNKLSIKYNGGSLSSGWLDYILVHYDKKLSYSFPSVLRYKTTECLNENKVVNNLISNVNTDNLIVWDVKDWTNPIQIIGSYSALDKTYSFNLHSDTLREIVVFHNTSNFTSPKLIGKIENQNLHATEPVDYVIITHPLFLEQATRLAKLHQDYNNTTTKVVTTEQVYNEFSSGVPDFLAYKEYLRMLYNKYVSENKNPKNVLLFGDGTFDNKNILKYNNNFVLTFQEDNKYLHGDNYPCEDYIGYLSPNAKGFADINQRDSLLIGVGRLPANSIDEATNLVNKSERYILKQDVIDGNNLNDWRNTMLITADDAKSWGEMEFITHAENIYNQAKLQQPQLNAIKVYSDAYMQFASSSGKTYPEASKAVNQQMNKGCLIFNYVGHGSENHLSEERLITITDIMSWKNYNSMPLMITSTCEFARYDMVDKPSGAEYTLYNKNGGMIALITASRPINSDDQMNQDFHKYVLEKTGNTTRSFGQAYAITKNIRRGMLSQNKRSVVLLGDPALRISIPKYDILTTSINSANPQIEIDTLKALSNVSVSGKIIDSDSNVVSNFNGKILITLFDKSSNYYTLDNENIGARLEFEQQKNILHRGKANVENGLFTYNFTIPKDIAYNYGFGKFSYYAQADSVDAGGYCNSFLIGGIDTSVEIQETRPLVRLFIADSTFLSGGITSENPELFAIISDKIAINTVGSGLGHDITATLDNAANTFILNDYFEQDETDPNKGYVRFPFSSLKEGEHTLTLKAWNIFNFSSSETITFNVVSKNNETFTNLKNYPNPFQETTNFYLEHNQKERISSAEIQIFNTSGMIVKTIKANIVPNSFSIGPISWNGTTDGGQKLKAGIYMYRMLLNVDGNKEYTQTQKLVIF